MRILQTRTVITGRFLLKRFEGMNEMRNIVKAHLFGDLVNFDRLIPEQLFGLSIRMPLRILLKFRPACLWSSLLKCHWLT